MRAPWLLLATLLLCSTALAEDEDEPADDDDSAAEDEPEPSPEPPDEREIGQTVVVTATGEPRLLSESPHPVRVLDEETVRRSPASDVAELLSRAPGVPVMAQGVDQRGGVAGISLQGIPAGRTLVLVDGRPVAGDVGGIVDLGQFPTGALERVEIVEGPMSALYGSDALGGVINLITRQPGGESAVDGRIQAGSDRSLDGQFSAESSTPEGLFGSASATLKRREAIDLDSRTEQTDLDARTSAGMRLAGGWGNEATRIDGSVLYTHDRRAGVTVRTNNAIEHDEVYDSPKRTDRVVMALGQRIKLSRAARLRWNLSGTAYHATFAEDLRDSPVSSLRRTRIDQLNQLTRFDLSAVSGLSLSAGIEWGTESLAVERDQRVPGGERLHTNEVERTREWSVEPWIQGDLRFFGDRLELLPGVRMTVHDAFGVNGAPSLAVRVKLWQGATLRVSGARGYRAPSLKDRFLVFDHSALGYVVYGDPALQPESSWGLNLSLDQDIEGIVHLRIGGFANRLENLITFVNAGVSGGVTNVFEAKNIAGARTVGAQATGELKLSFLRVTAAYRFLWAWADDGFFLPDSPVHGLRATVEGIVTPIDLSVYTAVGWESERFVDAAQRLRSPGLVRWDVRVEKRFVGRHDLSVYVGVDNILNQHRDPSVDGDFRPVIGRRIVGGVRGRLGFPGEKQRPGASL